MSFRFYYEGRNTGKDEVFTYVLLRSWGAGGPPFMIFRVRHSNRGCPILAFFARVGRDAARTTGLVTTQSGSTNLRLHSRLPPFANYAKNGAPALYAPSRRSKPRHPSD